MKYTYYLRYSDYCPHLHCYLYDVSADVSSGLFQVFLVGLGNLLFEVGIILVVEIPEEGRRAYQPKRCTYNNEDEDNIPNNTNNTNRKLTQASYGNKYD